MRPYDWTPTDARSATTDLGAAPRPQEITVAAAVDDFIDAAQSGGAANRSGRPYRPSALRDLRGILEYHVVPDLGDLQLRDLRRSDVQTLVDRLGADRLSESRIRSVVSALRALYGYAIEQGHVEFNPADGLVMPRANGPVPGATGEPWDSLPAWKDRPPRPPAREERDDPGHQEPSADRRQEPSRRSQHERVTYDPIAPLPERILSIAVRAVFALFAIVAVVSLIESL